MMIKVYSAILFGSMWDDSDWTKVKVTTSAKEAIEWANGIIKKKAKEWDVLAVPHDYGDTIDDEDQESVFKLMEESDIDTKEECVDSMKLVLEDDNANRVFCIIHEATI